MALILLVSLPASARRDTDPRLLVEVGPVLQTQTQTQTPQAAGPTVGEGVCDCSFQPDRLRADHFDQYDHSRHQNINPENRGPLQRYTRGQPEERQIGPSRPILCRMRDS